MLTSQLKPDNVNMQMKWITPLYGPRVRDTNTLLTTLGIDHPLTLAWDSLLCHSFIVYLSSFHCEPTQGHILYRYRSFKLLPARLNFKFIVHIVVFSIK